MNQRSLVWIGGLVLLGLAAGGYWWLQQAPTSEAAPPAPAAITSAPVPAPVVASAPAQPQIKHPIEAVAAASATPAAPRPLPAPDKADAYVTDALVELLGRKGVLTFLSADGFAARVVATVDNLDRPHAAARLWPVNPTPARFTTVDSADGTLISAQNASRYAPVVQFITTTNAPRMVALYRQLYPLFQHAYEELGYPGKYFNDRLVQVIDHLLAAPEPAGPLKVKLTEVKGPIASATPWLRYEYLDPELEARSAGHKLLMRVGPENARQIKAKLAEVRGLIAR